MLTIIVLGYQKDGPVDLYCGSDGVKAAAAEERARESGKFDELRVVRTGGYIGNRVAHVPTRKKSTESVGK